MAAAHVWQQLMHGGSGYLKSYNRKDQEEHRRERAAAEQAQSRASTHEGVLRPPMSTRVRREPVVPSYPQRQQNPVPTPQTLVGWGGQVWHLRSVYLRELQQGGAVERVLLQQQNELIRIHRLHRLGVPLFRVVVAAHISVPTLTARSDAEADTP